MKLTATQERIYRELITKVNEARECKDYDEYWSRYFSNIQARWKEEWKCIYDEALVGIVSIYRAKHESLKKLEMWGLIEIIDIELNKIKLIENK